MIDIILYVFTGLFAGLMSGILGVGGGVIVVPALLMIFDHHTQFNSEIIMHVAAATSLAIMVFTSQASIRAHSKLGTIAWNVYAKLALGIILGTTTGAILSSFIPTAYLKIILGIFLIFIAIKMVLKPEKNKEFTPPSLWVDRLVSYVIGLKSGLLGIGGGALIIPYLNYCGMKMREITPVSSLCTLTVSIIGTITFIIVGWHHDGLVEYTTGYVYWVAVFWVALPSILIAPIGARLAYWLPLHLLQYLFIIILILTAINLLV